MFEIGEYVKVVLPKRVPPAVTAGMEKYNGTIAKVIKITSSLDRVSHFYELEGVVSGKGKPYSFVSEWLSRTDKSEVEDESEAEGS